MSRLARFTLLASLLGSLPAAPALAVDPWLDGLQRPRTPSPSPTAADNTASAELAWFEAQIRQFPAMAALHYQYALRQHQAGASAKAEAAYREALRLDPNLRAAAYHLAALLQDRPEAAQAVLEQALERWVADPDLHYALGLSYERLGMPQLALAAYERALSLAPQHEAQARLPLIERQAKAEPTPESRMPAIIALLKSGKASEAQLQLRRLLRDHPTFTPAYEQLIGSLEAGGKHKAAANWREQLDLVSPCRTDNRFRLGRYYYWAGYGELALTLLRAQQDCKPGPGNARLLAQVLSERNQSEQALSTLQAALRQWPGDAGLQAAQAQLSFDLGQYAQAQAGLDALLKRKPVPPEAHYLAGMLHARAGRSAAAIASFKQALALSGRPEYRKALALAYVRAGMSSPAHKELQLYLQARPAEAASLQPLLDQLARVKPRGKF